MRGLRWPADGKVAAVVRRALLTALVLFPLLMLPDPIQARQGESRWVLTETLVNPENAPTEFEVGVTPTYFESPRFDGTFERYAVSAGSIVANVRSVDHGVEYWNATISFSIEPPPAVLTPGETVTLRAQGNGSGSHAPGWGAGFWFQFWGDGVQLEGEQKMGVGINPELWQTAGSVAPTFRVPEPWGDEAEIRLAAGLWNCGACSVVWVYRAEFAPPETTTSPPSTTTTEPPPPASSTAPDEPAQCIVRGLVTDGGARPWGPADRGGHPLAGVRISLLLPDGFEETVTATGPDGRYELTIIEDDLPLAIDSGLDEFMVRLRLAEAAHNPSRFEVAYNADQTDLWSRGFVLDTDCADGVIDLDFPLGSIPDDYTPMWPTDLDHWDDLAEIYHRIHSATLLADLLGQPIDYGGPLLVCAFCSDTAGVPTGTAYWCGAFSNGDSCSPNPNRPYIGIGDQTSLLSNGGWPDNREYHEFGHHFLADAFGNALPSFAGQQNHEGYYINPISTDAWTEGFAEFYSMMVTKHVDERTLPHYYRLAGEYWNLEIDYRAWSDRGRLEELGVAGVLLDLEDGPDDYARGRRLPDVVVSWYDTYQDPALGTLIVGEVHNRASDFNYSEQTMVAAEFRRDGRVVGTAWGITTPWDIPGSGTGFFAVIVPAGLAWDDVSVVVFEGRPGDVGNDDDPVNLTLQEVFDTIVSYLSVQPESNGYPFDVADLYSAFSSAFGGADVDGNGMDDIDQVFVAHGFYADTDGDRSFRSEIPGGTDHPARRSWEAMLPRRDVEPPPSTLMTVDTGGIPAALVVQITFPEPHADQGYGYIAESDGEGRYRVAVPPEGHGATVTLAVLADGYEPALLATIDADAHWAEVEEAGDGYAPSFAAALVPDGGDRGGSSGVGLGLIAGGSAVVLAAAGWALVRRRRSAGEVRDG